LGEQLTSTSGELDATLIDLKGLVKGQVSLVEPLYHLLKVTKGLLKGARLRLSLRRGVGLLVVSFTHGGCTPCDDGSSEVRREVDLLREGLA
jgi:hypothetical protein